MEEFRVVIADDDEDDYYMISQVLTELGLHYQLKHVTDGQLLLDYLFDVSRMNNALPDLVILDINMPAMDGIKALQIIRSYEQFTALPVIMYSTSAIEEQAKYCKALGAKGFVSKGNTMAEIISFAKNVNTYLEHAGKNTNAVFVHKSNPLPIN